VCDLARTRRAPIAAHIRDDQGTFAKAQLRAMILPDSNALDEPECLTKPGYGVPHIRVDQYGNDSRLGHRSVLLHLVFPF
jgi:hypothetical protein